MFKREMRQQCQTCKGSGVNTKKPISLPNGQPLLAPVYEKGEGNRQQFANCGACGGTGYTMQPAPKTIFVEGEKQTLSDEEYRARYTVAA